MANKYLDENGLLYFWQKIKALFVSDVTYDSTNKKIQKTKNGTTSDVVTLSTVATSGSYGDLSGRPTIPSAGTGSSYPVMDGTRALGSQAGYARVDHVHPSDTSRVPTTRTINGKALSADISLKTSDLTNDSAFVSDADYVHTDSNFTSAEKTKLAGIATGAEVNQNAFSNVKVGSTTIASDAKTDTLELVAGSNVTLTPDATNDKVTIDAAYPAGTYPLIEAGTDTTNRVWSAGLLHNYIDTVDKVFIAIRNVTSYSSVHDAIAYGKTIFFAHNSAEAPYPCWVIAATVAMIKLGIIVGDSISYSSATVYAADDTWEMASNGNIALTSSPTFTGTPKAPTASATTNDTQIATTAFVHSLKGIANGVAPLDANSKIDAQYLPSYVDDVVEAYARSGQTALSSTWLATGSASGTVITPEAGKIYVLMNDSGDYSANSQFRWGGSAYVKLADGGVTAITNAEIDTIVAA